MRVCVVLTLLGIALSGCKKAKKSFWNYKFELPADFIAQGNDVDGQWFWKSQDGTVEIGHLRYSAERTAFPTLDDFAVLVEEPGFRPRPNFRRAPNGLDVAVDLTAQGWTQIAVSNPENTEDWEIFLFGISPGDPAVRETRLLRETAIIAILSGRSIRD